MCTRCHPASEISFLFISSLNLTLSLFIPSHLIVRPTSACETKMLSIACLLLHHHFFFHRFISNFRSIQSFCCFLFHLRISERTIQLYRLSLISKNNDVVYKIRFHRLSVKTGIIFGDDSTVQCCVCSVDDALNVADGVLFLPHTIPSDAILQASYCSIPLITTGITHLTHTFTSRDTHMEQTDSPDDRKSVPDTL